MTATAKIFMHGRSQAVRLPKEFRFEGSEVRVSKVGNKVVLEPLVPTEAEIAAVWAKIDALRNGEDLFPDGGFDDPLPAPDPRKFFE
jgi:antitoxin VapB